MNDDQIYRQAAIDTLTEYGNGRAVYIGAEEAVRRIEQLPPAQSAITNEYDLKKIYSIYVKIAQALFVYQPSKPKTITAMPFDWLEVQNLLEKYLEDHGADFDALCREYVSENVKDDHLPPAHQETEERTEESAQNVPNDDLISRKAAIDAAVKESQIDGAYGLLDTKSIADLLSGLPSAQPATKDTNVLNNDCISRQAALDALRMDISIIPFAKAREYVREAIETIYNRLEKLPPAQLERKKGKWIVIIKFEDCYFAKCNECKVTQVFYYNKPLTNFCPNCGAEMRCEQDE